MPKNEKTTVYKILYEKYVNDMFSYGIALGIEEETLFDLIHDVFLHLIEHQNELPGEGCEKYYLLKSLKNRWISYKRKEVCIEDIYDVGDYEFSISVSGLSLIEEEEKRKEVMELVGKMLQCLTGRQKEAIYLRFMQGLEYDEIAKLLGLTAKGSRKLVYRAMDRIRERYLPVLIYFLLTNNFFSFNGVKSDFSTFID